MGNGVSFGLKIEGLSKFDDSLEAWKLRVDAASERIVTKGGSIIANNARREFLGGPNSPSPGKPTHQSGATQTSIVTLHITHLGLGSWMSETGPTVPWGRRLELGFHGVDSLGRNYGPPNKGQAERPFLRPGLRYSALELDALATEEWQIAQNA